MYLPRDLISHLYKHLVRTHHAQSPSILVLVALEPDALCACRILTALLKRDYIPHNIIPVSGYGDLARAGETQVRPLRTQNGGSGGTVVCLGVGGLVDLSAILGLDGTEEQPDATGGVEIWVIDARRPWNLGNVFGGKPSSEMPLAQPHSDAKTWLAETSHGKIQRNYRPGRGGVIVYDDGDIEEELRAEREAYFKLEQLPPVEDDGEESDGSETESDGSGSTVGDRPGKKRKSWSEADQDGESDNEDGRPRQRQRSNSQDLSPLTSQSPPGRRLLTENSDRHRSSNPDSPSTRSPTGMHYSTRGNRRRILRIKRKYEAVLHKYYASGASYSEPISSILYSLAGELGREDNNLLWHAIVGVTSLELYGRSMAGVGISAASGAGGSAGWGGERGERVRQVLRDEVRRLNPPDLNDSRGEAGRAESSGVIPTTARSPTDTSIRLSPEPRFLLIRHWSLYDSMLHSPYLGSRLHIWSETGHKRLKKLLAKMGVSLVQSKQSYTHMDMDLKKDLRKSLLKYAPLYGLDGLVPPAVDSSRGRQGWGFVRSWGWNACLSSTDVGVIIGAILEVGRSSGHVTMDHSGRNLAKPTQKDLSENEGREEGEEYVSRFWDAYDALENISHLQRALPIAQHLHRAIVRTGTSIICKRQIRHLRAFRMAIVKEGPDVQLFTHPGALTKLALWVGEAIAEQEREAGEGGKSTPLILASLNEGRGVYIVVGTGGGGGVVDWEGRKQREEKRRKKAKAKEEKVAERQRRKAARMEREESEGESDEEEESEEDEDENEDIDDDDYMHDRGVAKNRFGNAFQDVVDETNARVRIDSFEHCVVEVKKEDLSGFLESLSLKTVVG